MSKNRNHIVGRFKEDLSIIEFYEIISSHKNITILKRKFSETNNYFVYNDDDASFGCIRYDEDPIAKDLYIPIMNQKDDIFVDKDQVFFWADSKFVTEYGLPEYDRVVDIYKRLLDVRKTDNQLHNTSNSLKEQKNIFVYLYYQRIMKRFWKVQDKALRDIIKEFKVIW